MYLILEIKCISIVIHATILISSVFPNKGPVHTIMYKNGPIESYHINN